MSALPHFLIAEDDPVTAEVLLAATQALPATALCVPSCAEALALAREHAFSAWLLDAHLRDGDGAGLLRSLRALPGQASTPALAHTAGLEPRFEAQLRACGFDAVVAKPVTMAQWQAAVRRLPGLALDWDDAAALRALNGVHAHVQTMRELFLAELPKQHTAIATALECGDVEAARNQLHRLQGSCGFVGAMALAQAAQRLHDEPANETARQEFEACVTGLLAKPPVLAAVGAGMPT